MKTRPTSQATTTIAQVHAKFPTQKPGSRRKLILVVFTLSIMGFFIIRLQQAEPPKASVATALLLQKKEETPLPMKVWPDRTGKTKPAKKEVQDHARSVLADIRWRKNLVGETVLEGTLTNTSEGVSIKDPVLVVTWLSRTKTKFATTHHSIPAVLGAKTTMPYKLKVKSPGKYAALKVSVASVTVL